MTVPLRACAAVAALALCGTCGCALRRIPSRPATSAEGRRRLASYRDGVEVEIPLKPLTGPAPYCGAYAAAMVTGHLGLPIEPATIRRAVFDPARAGISNRALAAFLRKEGFECYNVRGSLADLRRLLERKIPPVLVLRGVSLRSFHYVVVVGLAPSQGLVAVNNPFCGREILTRSELEAAWAPAGHTLLVVARARKSKSLDGVSADGYDGVRE